MTGELLDNRYELKHIIGEGGMGTVFKATQLSVGRDVAIKVMKDEMFEEYGLVRRFKLEMEIISSLQHPNIVRLLDSGHDRRLGVLFLVMEYVEGVSLGTLLYECPEEVALHPSLALEVGIQICAALTEPHQLGVIHRDLKPDNIILTVRSDEQLAVKLLDFGVARIVNPHERLNTKGPNTRLTATGGIVGTPPYIAPELCEAGNKISAKSDIYAVGALLFELLTGFPPFTGRSTAEVLYKHVHEPAPSLLDSMPLTEFQGDLLDALIAQMLAKDPEDRPKNALEVKKLLEEVKRINHIASPTLNYSPGAPKTTIFDNYIIDLDEVINGTYKPKKIATLPNAPSSQLLKLATPQIHTPIPPAHHTSELPHISTAHSSESDDFSEAEEDEQIAFSPQRPVAKYIASAAILLVGGAVLIYGMSQSTPTPEEPGITTSAAGIVASPQTDMQPRLEEISTQVVLTPAIQHASGSIHQASTNALELIPKTKKISADTPPPKLTSTRKSTKRAQGSSKKSTDTKPEPTTKSKPKQPNKLKNKIDWLYQK